MYYECRSFALAKRAHLLQATSATFILALAILLLPPGTIFQTAHASTVTIHLVAYYASGWNGTTNPNPTITVQQGDSVTIVWSNGDTMYHQFLLDIDKDGYGDVSDCSPTADPCTGTTATGGTVTFTASTAGSFTYYCTFHPGSMKRMFIVQPPGFSMAPNPSSLTILQGSSSTSAITLSSEHGFTGTINLGASVSPTGPTASLMPMSVIVSPGYTATINGTSGSATNMTTVNITVTIPDFNIKASLPSLSVAQGSTATTTITLTSLSGFKGTLTLTGTVSQTGPTVTFSPASVTLASGGTVTSNMTVSAAGGTYPTATGSYPVTVTVTNGALTHSTTVEVTVGSIPSGTGTLPLTVLIGVAVAIIAAAGAAIYLVRRRTSQNQPSQ